MTKKGIDKRTLVDMERHGMSAAMWRARKRHYRRSGLKQGDWHTLKPNCLNIESMRKGMVIENKTHGNRYVVLDVSSRTDDRFQRPCIIVCPPEHIHDDYQVRKLYCKALVDLTKFKLVIV